MVLKFVMLASMFIVHWVVMFAAITYIWWGRKSWDKYYLFCWLLVILHWLFLGECAISKIEKQMLYDEETIRSQPYLNPSLQLYQKSGVFTLVLTNLLFLMYIANIVFVFMRMNTSLVFVVFFVMAFLGYNFYFRIQEYKNINNK